ncbi:MAG TPA: hypothetical protein VKY73_04730 [Polyangiaceae bacterium]|nr:hypothetical protein [Polyangiaceae bacterium]
MRRLGVGGGRPERPVRAQLVVAVVSALTIIAVPLYLMRRPSGSDVEGQAGAPGVAASVFLPAPSASAPEKAPPENIQLARAERVRCGNGSRPTLEGGLCDRLVAFEDALAKAILDTEECAPRPKREPETINHVLRLDFEKRTLHVFPGASGDLRGTEARRATECVKRALAKPDWTVPHLYRHYVIAILATYLPEPVAADANTPRFE